MPHNGTGGQVRVSALAISALGTVWGFAEATAFFIVPDVLLTWIALNRPRLALWSCLWALGGALAGGSVMYFWGANDRTAAERFLVRVPAIDTEMLDDVRQALGRSGAAAVYQGPARGQPYKIYAVYADSAGIAFVSFLLISIPARLVRFALTTATAALLAKYALASFSLTRLRIAHVSAWMIFYAWYFWQLSG